MIMLIIPFCGSGMIVVDLHPISVRIGEIDLFHTIHTEGGFVSFTLPAEEWDVVLPQPGHKLIY